MAHVVTEPVREISGGNSTKIYPPTGITELGVISRVYVVRSSYATYEETVVTVALRIAGSGVNTLIKVEESIA